MNAVMPIAGVVIREIYRRKDFYVLFILTALLTLLAGSVNIFNDDRIIRHVKEISLLLIWISSLVLCITMTARQLPMEQEARTIFPLLAKPVSRCEVILGKFVGCWSACLFALVVFYSFFLVITMASDPDMAILPYLQAAVLHGAMLGVVTAMTLLGSIVFTAPSSTVTILLIVCTAILTIGRHLNKVAIQQAEPVQSILYALYFILPHLEFYDVRDLIIHNWPPIPWMIFGAALLYAAVYMTVLLLLAMKAFQRKAIAE